MSKKRTKDVLQFLRPFPDNVKNWALWLREFVWDLHPDCDELISAANPLLESWR